MFHRLFAEEGLIEELESSEAFTCLLELRVIAIHVSLTVANSLQLE